MRTCLIFLTASVLSASMNATAVAQAANVQLTTAAKTWTQAVEDQPSVARGSETESNDAKTEEKKPEISTGDFNAGPRPKWIWGPNNGADYILQTEFTVTDVSAAKLMASCDNVGSVSINGSQVASSSEWQEPMSADVTERLKPGKNVITASVQNQGGVAAFVLKLAIRDNSGKVTHVVTNPEWTIATKNLENGAKVAARGNYGDGPWGNVFDNAATAGRVPQGVFETLPGFQVQKLFTVPKDELGSWVCIAFDNKGRLLASDQEKKGICRITLPPVDSKRRPDQGRTNAGTARNNGNTAENSTASESKLSGRSSGAPVRSVRPTVETVVERLDFSQCEYQPSGAQGMLWAFDSLYFCCNGGPGSGLYRARDTDGDDQFDECVKLKAFKGGGEHGPHSIRLSPDGKRIFVIAGNHTDPPFKAGEELENENYSSRIPTNWGEDLLLPRMWDANGHARGKLAPGGWIASTDPDGKTWEIWSVGYRNPYDMAFNADGELFAYDADMEWDVGSPWYRPTRVVHATSGSEFGWRSGTGKWPEYFVDSLPAMIDVGPGSPVGVEFGYGAPLAANSEAARNAPSTVRSDPSGRGDYIGDMVFAPVKFPAEYQTALYICDWTFGTMYAIHTKLSVTTYRATKEEFLSRTPLPLTDVAAGPDGALYFTIGGRGNQSELFRVVYAGGADTSAVNLQTELHNPGEQVMSRGLLQSRRNLENFHVGEHPPEEVVTAAMRGLGPLGVQMNYAARLALERVPVEHWVERVAEAAHKLATERPKSWRYLEDDRAIVGAIGLARQAEPKVFDILNEIGWPRHEGDQLNLLRAYQLAFVRVAEPEPEARKALGKKFEDVFPQKSASVNRELATVMVYLQSPRAVKKLVAALNAPPQREDVDMGDLLTRNRGYGKAIKAMIDNQPDKQQMWYAFCLRVAEAGWTPDLRADYYRWFGKAQTWSGGNSFKKFLQNIENEAWEKTPFDHRVLVEKAGARTPYTVPELPKPVGPGKAWTIDEVRAMAADGLKKRSFENGQRTFAATRCIVCHRFAGDGGATGPDLTQLAGRFNLEALTEAIMDPSKVISDQYRASTVVTTSGKTLTGRIVSENDQQISVLTDPEDSTKIVDVPKDEVDEMLPSKISIMPADLLKPLNKDEVLDLLAYLLSRGDEKHPMFRK